MASKTGAFKFHRYAKAAKKLSKICLKWRRLGKESVVHANYGSRLKQLIRRPLVFSLLKI
jgi:hypothetical protein